MPRMIPPMIGFRPWPRRRISAQSAGDSDSALTAEISIDTETTTANCWKSWPVMPGMKPTGTKTESSTSVMARIGAVILAMARLVASATETSGSCSSSCSTASTTTMASSTTMPMASTTAKSETVFAVKPSASSAAKVPTSATGTAIVGTSVARRLPRKRKTTRTTSTKASSSVWITSDTVSLTNFVES